MKQKLMVPLIATLVILTISVQPVSASPCFEFHKFSYGPSEVKIKTYAEWLFAIHISADETYTGVKVTDKIPAELEVVPNSFAYYFNDVPSSPFGTVTVQKMGKGNKGAVLITWTIDTLAPGYYIITFWARTVRSPSSKWVGFTDTGTYLINYGATMSYFYMGTQYFVGPTGEAWVTVYK